MSWEDDQKAAALDQWERLKARMKAGEDVRTAAKRASDERDSRQPQPPPDELRDSALAYWRLLRAEIQSNNDPLASPEAIEAARQVQLRANERFAVRTPTSGIAMTDDLRRKLEDIRQKQEA